MYQRQESNQSFLSGRSSTQRSSQGTLQKTGNPFGRKASAIISVRPSSARTDQSFNPSVQFSQDEPDFKAIWEVPAANFFESLDPDGELAIFIKLDLLL